MGQAFARQVRSHGFDVRTVTYGGHPDQVFDLVLSPAGASRPLVVVIHGGFWRVNYDRGHTAPQCGGLARAGFAVAALEYRRVGGGGGWPTTFADVAAGIDAVLRVADERVDPGRAILMGHSAGGHLALWAAGRHNLPPDAPGHRATPTPLRGVVALGAVADLGWAFRHRLGAGAAADLLGAHDDSVLAQRLPLTDPAALLPTGIPTVLVHGVRDDAVPADCAAAYATAATAACDRCELRLLDGVGHFEPIDPYSAAWSAVLGAAESLAG